jgi:hypothetical protein
MRRAPLILAVVTLCAFASPAFAQTLSDDSVIVTEGESPPDAMEVSTGDIANVINPDVASGTGIVKLVKESDEYVDVVRSGEIVERLSLIDDGTCLVGTGQIGAASFCSGLATLKLEGRPNFDCPDAGSNEYGPCSMPDS